MDEYIKREYALKAIDRVRCEIHKPHEKYVIGERLMEVFDSAFDACDRGINRIPAEDAAPKSDVAREIFTEIKQEIELALESNYKVKRDAQDDNETLANYVDGKIACAVLPALLPNSKRNIWRQTMKILVSELPAEPKDCLFSEYHSLGCFYVCTLRRHIEDADTGGTGYKPKCICKDCSKCDKLGVVHGLATGGTTWTAN